MKKLFFSLATMLSLSTLIAQNVGINTNTPHASAALDVVSTTQGVLVPRMTQSDRNLITSPATGLLVYQTDATPGFYFYNGSAWTSLSGGGSSYTAGTGISIAGNVISNTGDNDNSTTNEIELPTQSGQAGKFLNTNGTTTSWQTALTSEVDGSITNEIELPSQSGQTGKYLSTNGTTASWQTVSGGGSLPSQTGNGGKVLSTDGTNASWISKQERYLFENVPDNNSVHGHIIRLYKGGAPSSSTIFNPNSSTNPGHASARVIRGTQIFSTTKTLKSFKYFYPANNYQGTGSTSMPGSTPITGQQNITFILQRCNANAPTTETVASNTCVDVMTAAVPVLTSDVVQLTADTWVNLPLNANATLSPGQYFVIRVNQATNVGNVSNIYTYFEALIE